MILRLLLRISLYLLIVFTLIGVLISREWGWNEYASDELYLVYSQITDDLHYSIINTDGGENGEELTWQEGTITALDCSPDGRTLAVLIESAHIEPSQDFPGGMPNHVLIATQSTFSDIPLYWHFDGVQVANNGIVALSDLSGESSDCRHRQLGFFNDIH